MKKLSKLQRRLHNLVSLTPPIVWIFIAAGAFLRLYRIEDFATFLADQGRDAIVMHDIITLKHFPALGPVTSIGSMFLGPLYYYMMSPWLLIFGMNPVGPAVGVAVLGILALWLQYHAVNDMFEDRMTAIVSVALAATSSTLIEYNRFSWNPNLLAPLVFFTLWAWYRGLTKKNIWYFALAGALFSASMQMHYLSVVLVFVFAITYLTSISALRAPVKTHFARFVAVVASWGAVLAPFLLFEAIHSFPNLKSALLLAQSPNTQTSSRLGEIFSTFAQVFHYSTQVTTQDYITTTLFICIAIIAVVGLIRKQPIGFVATSLVVMTVATSYYTGAKFPHYLGSFYLLLYTFIAYLLSTMFTNRTVKVLIGAVFVLLFVSLQAPNYRFLYENPSTQIARARRVSDMIALHTTSLKYRITALPEQYASFPYRYMLTAYYVTPIDTDNKDDRGDELFVICEQSCEPRKSSLWDIAFFSPEVNAGKYTVDGVTIYKLTR